MVKRKRHIAVWLRRFNKGKQAETRLRFLESVFYQWGHLITLRDTSIHESVIWRQVERVLRIIGRPGIVLWYVGFCFFESRAGAFAGVPRAVVVGEVVFGAVIIAALYYSVRRIYKLTRRRVVPKLSLTSDLSSGDLESVLRRVRLARRDKLGVLGPSVVFGCPMSNDNDWKDVIVRIAPLCDLVFVDASDFTDALEWEVNTVLSVCSAKPVVLLVDENVSSQHRAWGQRVDDLFQARLEGRVPLTLVVPDRFPSWQVPWKVSPYVANAARVIEAALSNHRVGET